MLKELKKEVYEANIKLVELGLVLFTWGNVSGIDRETGYIAIKPSGVPYKDMTYEDIVIVDTEGSVIDGQYKPSSDTATHIELYKEFKHIGAVVHTHSKWGTIFAQAQMPLPPLGTTHADNFYGEIPVTLPLDEQQVDKDYEKETGCQIIETFMMKRIDPIDIPGVLVANHAPFTWGKTPGKAVENAAVLEYCAEMAYYTRYMNEDTRIKKYILDKHYLRKHGKAAYYGQ